MVNMGNKMKAEEIEEMMKEADAKGEGILDIEAFCQRLCPPKPDPKAKKGKKGRKKKKK